MSEDNQLEKTATLWHDFSECALELKEELEAKGYNLKIILSGCEKPVLSYPGVFLAGYNNIRRFCLGRILNEEAKAR